MHYAVMLASMLTGFRSNEAVHHMGHMRMHTRLPAILITLDQGIITTDSIAAKPLSGFCSHC